MGFSLKKKFWACVSCQDGVGWHRLQRNELWKQLQFGQIWGLQPFDGDGACARACVYAAFPRSVCVFYVFAVCYLLKVCYKVCELVFMHMNVSWCACVRAHLHALCVHVW